MGRAVCRRKETKTRDGSARIWAGLAWLTAACAALPLAGCASRPDSAVLTPVAASAPGATPVDIFVATSRARSEPGRNLFTANRSPTLNFAQFTISIPPNHVAAAIEWPSSLPADPKTSFATIGQTALDTKAFLADVNRAAAANKSGDVLIFIHGYNTTFEEALFRLAQLRHDVGRPVVPVLFAWPSRGEVSGYVADRDSAAYSRDYLEQLINDIHRLPNVRYVALAAHSMGSWLTVESLRQIKLRGRQLPKLSEVVLAAADIDVELFQTQLMAIGKLPRPITLLTSRDDGALAFSRRIGGNIDRVGLAMTDDPKVAEGVKRFGVRVIDVTSAPSDSSFKHDRYVTSVPVLAKLAAFGGVGPPPGDVAPGIYIFDARTQSLNNR